MERSADRIHKLRTQPAQEGPLGASRSDPGCPESGGPPTWLQDMAVALITTRLRSGCNSIVSCPVGGGGLLVASARPMCHCHTGPPRNDYVPPE